jgi:hypothetical protein
MFALRQTLLCFAVSAAALAVEPEAGFLQRIETNLAVIEHLLGTLRHVAVTTEEGGATRTRLTSEAWFVPDDAVETPVKVTLLEARGTEQREIAFWLDQGKLFLVKERTLVNQEASVMVTEHRRYFDGGHSQWRFAEPDW